jgi:hypothetical protein
MARGTLSTLYLLPHLSTQTEMLIGYHKITILILEVPPSLTNQVFEKHVLTYPQLDGYLV